MAKKAPKPTLSKTNSTDTAAKNSTEWFQWAILAAILVFTAVVYWPSLSNGWTNWDDPAYVTDNPDIGSYSTLATKEVAGNFHPLTMWTLAFDHHAVGSKMPDPAPYHRTNLWLHLLNTALTFLLIRRLRATWWVAGFVALIFAIHPMHVESVAWVSGRKDLLFSAFFLGGLLFFVKKRVKAELNLSDWAVVVVCFVLSCLSKPAAIVFPFIVLLTDWYLRPEGRRNWIAYGAMVAISAVFSVITLQYQRHVGAVVEDGYFSLVQRTLFAAYGFMIYLWKLVFPSQLSAFHPAPDRTVVLGGNFYAALAGAAGVLGAVVWAWIKGWRTWFYGLAFYAVMLALVLGFVKVGSALFAERYTYLAYTGLLLAIGIWGERFALRGSGQKLGILAASVVFVAFFTLKTREQIGAWRDGETLWSQIIALYPQDNTYSYRGYLRYQNSQWEKALEDFDKAYAIQPNSETTVHIRALCLQKTGKNKEAWAAFSEYEQKFPPKPAVQIAAAECLLALNRPDEAIARFEQALAAQPQNALSKALALNPKYLPALNNRGACRLLTNNWQGSVDDLTQSLALNANQPQMYDYRARAYEQLGRKAEAAADRAKIGK
jgi:protein O-mannosyl-transferase